MEKKDSAVTPLWLSIVLWMVAAVLMFGAAGYQERTGPTKELRGEFELSGAIHSYELVRSGNSREDAIVVIPDLGSEVTASLSFKRYPTSDEFTSVPFDRVGGEMMAPLPRQPAAGKLEYFIQISDSGGDVRIPAAADETVIIRFKDPVPIYFLLPHVLMMFFGLLIGIRTAMSALIAPGEMKRLAWVTLGLMTVGGMILGPIVQKYAFGAFWTGIPFGYDLTDNKTLIMWIVWIAVCGLFLSKRPVSSRTERTGVVVAALVMVVVYLIPHSLRGSELNYEAIDEGAPASEAVRSGRPG